MHHYRVKTFNLNKSQAVSSKNSISKKKSKCVVSCDHTESVLSLSTLTEYQTLKSEWLPCQKSGRAFTSERTKVPN